MSKDRRAVVADGRAAFYAAVYEDIRRCALDNGWAVGLHGSLSADMDIMAMPWVDDCVSFEDLIDAVANEFDGDLPQNYTITYHEKPHSRVCATIPIWGDFYLDVSTIIPAEEGL